ncbi:hypothetical protein B0A81_21145 [Flavobacterium plurextorum]|uniref:Uncharacterized protein n=1 Tax=Flavobacterium plurextorum TaxID=1114867 RepID=A0ABX4CNT9_9FLAO|nr:hypothetical protein [Flavobacterium plurextorum]OXA99777.1 hypothetical protein B0A81_21145 [Flavobacterium plurextorum]
MSNSIDIKFQNHFKLYVLLKDKIIFESELNKSNIKYYIDIETQALSDNSIRYFLLGKDQEGIDNILLSKNIIASTETINVNDFRDVKNYYKVYFIIALLVITLTILISSI